MSRPRSSTHRLTRPSSDRALRLRFCRSRSSTSKARVCYLLCGSILLIDIPLTMRPFWGTVALCNRRCRGSSRWTAYHRSISPSSHSAGPSFHNHCPNRAKGRRVFQAYRLPATSGTPGVGFTSRVLFGGSNARRRSAYGQHGCPDTASHPRSGRQARRTSRYSKAQSARSDRSSPVARGASAGRHRLLGLCLSWIGHSLIGVCGGAPDIKPVCHSVLYALGSLF